MKENHKNEKLHWRTLVSAGILILFLWLLLFVTIPFSAVPAATSDNSVLRGIVSRLNISAIFYFVLLYILNRKTSSAYEFWGPVGVYGVSWAITSHMWEWLAEYTYSQKDMYHSYLIPIDVANAILVTLINVATFLTPAAITLWVFSTLLLNRGLLFKSTNKVGSTPASHYESAHMPQSSSTPEPQFRQTSEVRPSGGEDRKECPRCAELIKQKAKYCRFCQYEYTDAEWNAEQKRLLRPTTD